MDAGSGPVYDTHLGFCAGRTGRAQITLQALDGRGKTTRSSESSSGFHYGVSELLQKNGDPLEELWAWPPQPSLHLSSRPAAGEKRREPRFPQDRAQSTICLSSDLPNPGPIAATGTWLLLGPSHLIPWCFSSSPFHPPPVTLLMNYSQTPLMFWHSPSSWATECLWEEKKKTSGLFRSLLLF